MPLVDHLDYDVFGFAPEPTTAAMMNHQARSQRTERRPQSSGGIHCPMVFGYLDSLQRKGQRLIHQSVDERAEQGYPTDIDMPCRTALPRHPTALPPAQRLADNEEEYSARH